MDSSSSSSEFSSLEECDELVNSSSDNPEDLKQSHHDRDESDFSWEEPLCPLEDRTQGI